MKKLLLSLLVSMPLLATSMERVKEASFQEHVRKMRALADFEERSMTPEEKFNAAKRSFFYHIKYGEIEYIKSFLTVYGFKQGLNFVNVDGRSPFEVASDIESYLVRINIMKILNDFLKVNLHKDPQ